VGYEICCWLGLLFREAGCVDREDMTRVEHQGEEGSVVALCTIAYGVDAQVPQRVKHKHTLLSVPTSVGTSVNVSTCCLLRKPAASISIRSFVEILINSLS